MFFALLAKKMSLVSLKIHANQFKSILGHLNQPKTFKKIDLNLFKMNLSETRMDFSESENPSKSI